MGAHGAGVTAVGRCGHVAEQSLAAALLELLDDHFAPVHVPVEQRQQLAEDCKEKVAQRLWGRLKGQKIKQADKTYPCTRREDK